MANYDTSAATVINNLAAVLDSAIRAALQGGVLDDNISSAALTVASAPTPAAVEASLAALPPATEFLSFNLSGTAPVEINFQALPPAADLDLIVFGGTAPVDTVLSSSFDGVVVLGAAPAGQANVLEVARGGTAANVAVQTGAGADSVVTARGADTVALSTGNDTVSTGQGGDTVSVARITGSNSSTVLLDGGQGNDALDLSAVVIANVVEARGSVRITLADGRTLKVSNVESFVYDADGNAATPAVTVGVSTLDGLF